MKNFKEWLTIKLRESKEEDFYPTMQEDPANPHVFADFLGDAGDERENFIRKVLSHAPPKEWVDFKITRHPVVTVLSSGIKQPQFIQLNADIAELLLPLWDEVYPGDDRPRKAIEAARTGKDAIRAGQDSHLANRGNAAGLAAAVAGDAALSAGGEGSPQEHLQHAIMVIMMMNVDKNRQDVSSWLYARVMEYKHFNGNVVVSQTLKPTR